MVNEIAQVKVKNTFLSRVYGWMTLALVISGVTAFLATTNETIIRLTIGNGFGFLILAVAELALVWWLTASIHKISSGAAFFAFILYFAFNSSNETEELVIPTLIARRSPLFSASTNDSVV